MSLIADYEQQYAVLTAETTAEIGKLDRSNTGKLEKRHVISLWSMHQFAICFARCRGQTANCDEDNGEFGGNS